MSLYKQFRRWVAWKRMSRKERELVAHILGFMNPNAWEVQQFKKEQR